MYDANSIRYLSSLFRDLVLPALQICDSICYVIGLSHHLFRHLVLLPVFLKPECARFPGSSSRLFRNRSHARSQERRTDNA